MSQGNPRATAHRHQTALAIILVLCGMACGGSPTAVTATPNEAEVHETHPVAKEAAFVDHGLQLEIPGTSLSEIRSRHAACAEPSEKWNPADKTCELFGGLKLVTHHCEGGCARWRYEFDGADTLSHMRLTRSLADVDESLAATFTEEAKTVAAELQQRFDPDPDSPEERPWSAVATSDETITLAARKFHHELATIIWTLRGVPSHHPVIEMIINVTTVEAPRCEFGCCAIGASQAPDGSEECCMCDVKWWR